MKNVFALLLVVCHLNSTMFLPQTTGVAIYDRQGAEQDEINSLTEYVAQVLLGRRDDSPEDEDDENDMINSFNAVAYSWEPSYNDLLNEAPVVLIRQVFSRHHLYRIVVRGGNIYLPPPKIIA